jgi:hypothetical protein
MGSCQIGDVAGLGGFYPVEFDVQLGMNAGNGTIGGAGRSFDFALPMLMVGGGGTRSFGTRKVRVFG